MRYWWVNHSKTFKQEVYGKYIWCPKLKKNGVKNHFYETLREVQRGDLVFSFSDAYIRAVGVARLPCYSCPKPDEFGRIGDAWNDVGWRVDVEFRLFENPFRLDKSISKFGRLFPDKYSPVQENGRGNQGAYLSEISRELAKTLLNFSEPTLLSLIDEGPVVGEGLSTDVPIPLVEFDRRQEEIIASASLPPTTREALIQARIGQGRFKENVVRYESSCRVTGVCNPIHLIASHIKPWRESSDSERLCGANGLLLTPSIDHLFDRGFVSFDDNGIVLVSPIADPESLPRMGVRLDRPIFSGTFNGDQRHFLEYHRRNVFLKSSC
jgi:putative restriction endonuclease